MIERLECQTRTCVQSVLAKWYCECLRILMKIEMRKKGRKNKGEKNVHTFGFEEGRSALLLMSGEVGMIPCSMDVKQAFDNVSPVSLSLVMREMGSTPILAGAILREQIGGRYDICFQETTVSGIPFDKSIKQGGKET